MVPVESLHFGDKGEGKTVSMWDKVGNSSSFLYVFGENADLLEFTGLTDKNGVEIYEGDILMYLAGSQSSMEVKFMEGAFVGEGPFLTRDLSDYFKAIDFESIEVIGNIFSNPELLKGEGAE